jgi:hypothetical protein
LHVTEIFGDHAVLWFTDGETLWPVVYRWNALTQTLHATSCGPEKLSTSYWALSKTEAQEKFEFLLSPHIGLET